jgi:hypothetical protein
VFALMPLGFLPPTFAVPVIGLVLAFGAAPDHVPGARPLGGGRRNWMLAALIVVFRDVALTRDGSSSRPALADRRRGDLARPVNPAPG